MTRYLALLRGINVGGKNIISMAALRSALEASGLSQVQTYIQSGNVIFCADKAGDKGDNDRLAQLIHDVIMQSFKMDVAVAVFSAQQWQQIIDDAPADWGRDPEWKHNLLVMLGPHNMTEVIAAIGLLKPAIEAAVPGDGVVYQQLSRQFYGRATTGKLASTVIYKQMTIRAYSTAVKLAILLKPTNKATAD